MEIQKYLEYINTLTYEQEPDYEFIRKLFKDGLRKRGGTDDGKNVKFTTGKVSSPSPSAAATELRNGHSSPEKETRDKATRQRPAAKVRPGKNCEEIENVLLYLQTQIHFLIGGECVTCHGSKLTNFLGIQQLELLTCR